jgi:hypothetical protein
MGCGASCTGMQALKGVSPGHVAKPPLHTFLPALGRFQRHGKGVPGDKKASFPAAFSGTRPRASSPYCSKPHQVQRRVEISLSHFAAAVAAGHAGWLTYTLIVSRVMPLITSDQEVQQLLAQHHIPALKRWFARQGEPFEAGISIERKEKSLGLHVHVVLACPARLAVAGREAVKSNLSRLAGKEVKCPALKFHCRKMGVATASSAEGWWDYLLKTAVPEGEVVAGVKGASHRPVGCKPRSWFHGTL